MRHALGISLSECGQFRRIGTEARSILLLDNANGMCEFYSMYAMKLAQVRGIIKSVN